MMRMSTKSWDTPKTDAWKLKTAIWQNEVIDKVKLLSLRINISYKHIVYLIIFWSFTIPFL